MVRCPLVEELAVAWRPRQQHPSGAAAERLAHGHEFRPPALERSKIPSQCVPQIRTRFALIPEPVEEQLMQDRRVHRDELLALETVDEKAGGLRVIEFGELFLYQVETLDRPAVIIVVMADNQPLGHALDLGRVARQRLELVGHERSSGQTEALTSIEIARSAVVRPLMRSLPGDKERSPRCSTPPALGSCQP